MPTMTGIELKVQLGAPSDPVVRLELAGRLSRDGWTEGKDPLVTMCGDSIYSRPVLMSLEKANYLDSTGVEWLLHANRKFREAGGRLILHSPTAMTMQFLKMMRMHLVLEMADDEEQARARLDTPRPA
jgi:anti-anti-sigma factor